MLPGLPIKGLDPALHPPRQHCKEPPGGDLRPAGQVIAALLERLGEAPPVEPFIGRWAALGGLDPEGEGLTVLSGEERWP
jgi:NADH-quinone oxidoreductase subunit G